MAVLFLLLLVDFALFPEEGGGGGEEEGRVCDSLVCSVAVFLFFASVLYCCLLIKGQLIERERERREREKVGCIHVQIHCNHSQC